MKLLPAVILLLFVGIVLAGCLQQSGRSSQTGESQPTPSGNVEVGNAEANVQPVSPSSGQESQGAGAQDAETPVSPPQLPE